MPEGSGPAVPAAVRKGLTVRAACPSERSWCSHPDSNRDAVSATDFKSVVSTYSTMRAVLACPAGFEPATHSLEGCCSIQLS